MLERFTGRELDASEINVLNQFENHGWTVMNIREENGVPGWAFTIGLFENYNHPEVVIFGLEAKNRHSILNWIGDNVKRGKAFAADEEHDWVIDGRNCVSRIVQPKWYRDLLGWAKWFYAGSNFPCVQCIWPAKDGSYPWEEQSPLNPPQPLLYESDVLTARMLHFVGEEELAKLDWPFSCDPHTGVFVSRCVVQDHQPIVRVVHDHEGDWQFLGHVADADADGGKLLCFHCVIEKDPGLRVLARLSPGWCAIRDDGAGGWRFEEVTPDQD